MINEPKGMMANLVRGGKRKRGWKVKELPLVNELGRGIAYLLPYQQVAMVLGVLLVLGLF